MMDPQTARTLPRSLRLKGSQPLMLRRPPRRTAVNSRLSLRVAVQCGWWLGLASAGSGCGMVSSTGPSTRLRFDLDVQVESDPSKPLAAVAILQGAKELGRTAADGSVRVTLIGNNGDVVALNVACPEGFASPEKPLSITLRPLVGVSVVPQYRARCEPRMRSLVVAVRAKGGSDLAVKHLGREIARTDSDGVAHALLKVPPAEQVTVVLDTSGADHTRLRPTSPEFTMTMPARDEVAVFDQTFSELVPPAKKTKKQGPAPLGPIKIEAPSRSHF
jgi:hypothetical protein